jgi:hypothetical protein
MEYEKVWLGGMSGNCGWCYIVPNLPVKTIRPTGHGDMKSVWARPNQWPIIPKGTSLKVKEVWDNLYGRWLKVVGPNGEEYDIDPRDVEYENIPSS